MAATKKLSESANSSANQFLELSDTASDSEEPVTRSSGGSRNKGKGKGKMIIESEVSDQEEFKVGLQELEELSAEDDVEMDLDEETSDPGVARARALAKGLKGKLSKGGGKGKGKALDGKEVAKSVSRALKGKGKAVDSVSGSGRSTPSRARKGKGKARVIRDDSSSDEDDVSDFAPPTVDGSEDEEEDEYDEEEVEAEESDHIKEEEESEDEKMSIVEDEEEVPKKKKKTTGGREKDTREVKEEKARQKKERVKVPLRKGAHISKHDKKMMKDFTNVSLGLQISEWCIQVDLESQSTVRAYFILPQRESRRPPRCLGRTSQSTAHYRRESYSTHRTHSEALTFPIGRVELDG